MNELRNHLDILFKNAPETRKAFEFKEELLANLEDHYEDLLNNGVPQEQAFLDVIHSIGNIDELFPDFEDSEDKKNIVREQNQKQAVIVTTAVALYMCSIVLFFLGLMTGSPFVGAVLMLIASIVPTCLLVYNALRYPKYTKQNDTILEDIRAIKSNSRQLKVIKQAATAILWLVTLSIYFLVSFATYAWHLTWILFLAAACVQTIIHLIIVLKENQI